MKKIIFLIMSAGIVFIYIILACRHTHARLASRYPALSLIGTIKKEHT